MKNKFEIRGENTAIFINNKKHGLMETIISTNKLGLAKEFPGEWRSFWDKGTKSFRVVGTCSNNCYLLHRWVTNAPKGKVVDHINHDTLDNTDTNLRVVTHGENNQNRVFIQKNNTSGSRNVYWDKKRRRWRVEIAINRKRTLRDFKNYEDAVVAAEKMRTEIYKFYVKECDMKLGYGV